jgi:hypothetical protein
VVNRRVWHGAHHDHQAPAHKRSPSPCAHPARRNAPPTSPSACSSPRQRVVAIRRSLYLGNLSLVLVATVRGARGSHVRLISGLAAPRERRRRPDDRTFSSVAGGRPRPWEAYQQNAGNRCADSRFRRSHPTVGAKGCVQTAQRYAFFSVHDVGGSINLRDTAVMDSASGGLRQPEGPASGQP